MLTAINDRKYWYNYRHEGGKVRRIYAGCGAVAEQYATWRRFKKVSRIANGSRVKRHRTV